MKKNTWKKLMSLALGAMMMLSLLTGCGSKTEDSAPADSTPAEETPADETPQNRPQRQVCWKRSRPAASW